MGVVENVLRKAKERAARASAKISGSNAVKFGPKIGIRSLLIKFKTCLYSYNEKVKMVLYSNAGTFFTSARFLGTLEVLGSINCFRISLPSTVSFVFFVGNQQTPPSHRRSEAPERVAPKKKNTSAETER